MALRAADMTKRSQAEKEVGAWLDGTCDWPGCEQDSWEEYLTGAHEGEEYCQLHIALLEDADNDHSH